MCVLTIVGKAFLWHQIRCIVAVLFRVGSGLESPDVIDQLVSYFYQTCQGLRKTMFTFYSPF